MLYVPEYKNMYEAVIFLSPRSFQLNKEDEYKIV